MHIAAVQYSGVAPPPIAASLPPPADERAGPSAISSPSTGRHPNSLSLSLPPARAYLPLSLEVIVVIVGQGLGGGLGQLRLVPLLGGLIDLELGGLEGRGLDKVELVVP